MLLSGQRLCRAGLHRPAHVAPSRCITVNARKKKQEESIDEDAEVVDAQSDLVGRYIAKVPKPKRGEVVWNDSEEIDDPEWANDVTDWHEFWNYSTWEKEIEQVSFWDEENGAELYELEKPVVRYRNSAELHPNESELSPTGLGDRNNLEEQMRFMREYRRADHISRDVIHELSYVKFAPKEHYTPYEIDHQVPFLVPELKYGYGDVRAIAEKRRKANILNDEWRRRQALLGKFPTLTHYKDVRVQQYMFVEEEWENWTDEEIENLIVLNGASMDPKYHGGEILNPLVVADFPALHIGYIEETEEFLDRIGRLVELPPHELPPLEGLIAVSEPTDDFLAGGMQLDSGLPGGDQTELIE